MAPTTEIADAFADIQLPGSAVELSGPDGETIFRAEDPQAIIEDLCTTAAETDPNAEPWPHIAGEPVEYVTSYVGENVADGLIDGIVRLRPLAEFQIHYRFRYAENWKQNGRTVCGQMKRPTGLLKNYAGVDYIVLFNWLVWEAMNPMQRVALVYHELRHGDSEGKVQGHDFEGFFDELGLFGTATYQDWGELAKAVGRGDRVRHQYSLDLAGVD